MAWKMKQQHSQSTTDTGSEVWAPSDFSKGTACLTFGCGQSSWWEMWALHLLHPQMLLGALRWAIPFHPATSLSGCHHPPLPVPHLHHPHLLFSHLLIHDTGNCHQYLGFLAWNIWSRQGRRKKREKEKMPNAQVVHFYRNARLW